MDKRPHKAKSLGTRSNPAVNEIHPRLLTHMWDQAAVFEDGKDLLRKLGARTSQELWCSFLTLHPRQASIGVRPNSG